jgi:hypothetical protein
MAALPGDVREEPPGDEREETPGDEREETPGDERDLARRTGPRDRKIAAAGLEPATPGL